MRKNHIIRISGAVLLVLLLAGCAHAAAPTISLTETRITTDPGDQYDPAIWDNIVVFTDYRAADTDVYFHDLDTGEETGVIVAPGNQELTDVANGIIVYTDYRWSDVIVYDVSTGVTRNITRPDKERLGRAFNSVDPATDGTIVAWQDNRDGNNEIYAMDLVSGEERQISDSPDSDSRPAVNGGHIVWQRCAAGGTCDIYYYEWAGGTTQQITNTPDRNEWNPDIYGSDIVYQDHPQGNPFPEGDIFVYNLDTSTELRKSLEGNQANPHIWGDNVVFDDLSSGLYHIGLWNLPSGEVFPLTSGTSGQILNSIWENRVVYSDDRNGDLEIYMTEFYLTPSGDPPVADAGPDRTVPPGVPITFNGGGSYDPDGTIVSYDWDFDDSHTGSGITTTHPFTDSGEYWVTLTVTDNDGLTGLDTAIITIHSSAESIEDLKATVESLGLKNQQGYCAKLDAALKSLAKGNSNAAANQLNAFINMVEAQRGKTLSAEQADALIASARGIIAYL